MPGGRARPIPESADHYAAGMGRLYPVTYPASRFTPAILTTCLALSHWELMLVQSATNLPPTPVLGETEKFIRTIYGCFDLDAVRRHVMDGLPRLLRACGIGFCLREPGRAARCWSSGS